MERTLFMHKVQDHLRSYNREIMSACELMLKPQAGFQSMQTKQNIGVLLKQI
jgi:hypothetical protein